MEEGTGKLSQQLSRWAHSPWTVASAIALGVGAGLLVRPLAFAAKPFGELYLALLQMCAMPLIICGVVASIGKILLDGGSQRYLGRLIAVILAGLLATAVFGTILGLVVRPGAGLSPEASRTLGTLLSSAEMSGTESAPHAPLSLISFLSGAIPRNIFNALSQGSQLPILLFSILLGIALGFNRTDKTKRALDSFEALFDALLKLIEWLLYLLPFGLFALLAAQVAEAGVGVFFAMLKLIGLINAAALVSIALGSVIVSWRTRTPYFQALSALGEPLLIAFATKSSFAAIPSTLRALQSRLRLDKHTTDLVIPLSVSLNPVGNVYYYGLSAIFIAQLYGVAISPSSFAILVLGSILAAVAGSALPGAAAIGVISILLEPLGLPVGSAVILILAIDPFIDPATTALNIHGSCVAASLVADGPAGDVPASSESPSPAAST